MIISIILSVIGIKNWRCLYGSFSEIRDCHCSMESAISLFPMIISVIIAMIVSISLMVFVMFPFTCVVISTFHFIFVRHAPFAVFVSTPSSLKRS